MNGILDISLVGLVLLVSLAYAAAALGPRAWRRRAADALASLASRLPDAYGVRRAAGRVAKASAAKIPGACGGCDDCGSQSPDSAETGGGEVHVPLDKIAKRG